MHDVDPLLLVLRWLHILAAMAAVGGAIFMRFALVPGASESLDETTREKLHSAVSSKWAKIVNVVIAILLLTGGANFVYTALPPAIPAMPYHALFGIKFFLAFGVFFLASALVGKSPAFAGIRRRSRFWLNALLAMALAIVLLGGAMNQIRNAHRASKTPVITVTTE